MKTVITIGVLMFFLTLSNVGVDNNCCPISNDLAVQDSIRNRLEMLDKKIAIAEKKVNTDSLKRKKRWTVKKMK